jgi:hypothetical protein
MSQECGEQQIPWEEEEERRGRVGLGVCVGALGDPLNASSNSDAKEMKIKISISPLGKCKIPIILLLVILQQSIQQKEHIQDSRHIHHSLSQSPTLTRSKEQANLRKL